MTTLVLWLCLGAVCVEEPVPFVEMTLIECQLYGQQVAAQVVATRPGWRLAKYECSTGQRT